MQAGGGGNCRNAVHRTAYPAVAVSADTVPVANAAAAHLQQTTRQRDDTDYNT